MIRRREAHPWNALSGAVGFGLLFVALFLPAYFGNDKINQMSSSAVRASRYLYSHGKSGPVVYLVWNPLTFPSLSNSGRA